MTFFVNGKRGFFITFFRKILSPTFKALDIRNFLRYNKYVDFRERDLLKIVL